MELCEHKAMWILYSFAPAICDRRQSRVFRRSIPTTISILRFRDFQICTTVIFNFVVVRAIDFDDLCGAWSEHVSRQCMPTIRAQSSDIYLTEVIACRDLLLLFLLTESALAWLLSPAVTIREHVPQPEPHRVSFVCPHPQPHARTRTHKDKSFILIPRTNFVHIFCGDLLPFVCCATTDYRSYW